MGLAVLVVAVAVAVELAVELVVELAMALDVVGMVAVTRLVVGVVTKTLQCLHLWLESIEAVTWCVNHVQRHVHSRNEKDLLQ